MWYQFILQNAHFSINLIAALVLFAIAWLYFDAWIERKNLKDGTRVLGFLLLSLSFVSHSVTLETGLMSSTLLSETTEHLLINLTRTPGYFLLILSQVLDPLQERPNLANSSGKNFSFLPLNLSLAPLTAFIFPPLSAAIGFLYLRRATVGLENHLKPVSLGFFILSLHELLSLRSFFQSFDNINIYNLVSPFGPLWIIEHLSLLIASLILGFWVSRYLIKRLQSQLFMIFTSIILVVFLLVTLSFTTLLLKNLETETLKQIETDVKVLQLALDTKKEQAVSDSQLLAQNPSVAQAIQDKSTSDLNTIAQTSLFNKKQNTLIFVGSSGEVLLRGENTDNIGGSLSNHILVKRTLLGESVSSIVTKDGVLSPQVSIQASSPVKAEGKIIGAVLVGREIDNAFVDGIKKATSLESSIYADNKLAATTLMLTDQKTRANGISQENPSIKQTVLQDGAPFTGQLSILNTPYLSSYLPLKDIDNVSIGMLFAGKEASGVLQTASDSIKFTFIFACILLILSFLPAFLIAKYISNQL